MTAFVTLRFISTTLMLITVFFWWLLRFSRVNRFREGVRRAYMGMAVTSLLIAPAQVGMFILHGEDRDLIIAALFAAISWFVIRALRSMR